MGAPPTPPILSDMRLHWWAILRSRKYRKADSFGRRMIELRYVLAKTLRTERRNRHITQKRLAYLMDAAPSTISYIECMSSKVRIDQIVRAFIILGMDDDAIAAAFNPGSDAEIRQLRARTSGRFYQW